MVETPHRSQVSLLLSGGFALALVIYLSERGHPLEGAILGVVVVGVGYLEYCRTRHHERTARRFEIEAESKR